MQRTILQHPPKGPSNRTKSGPRRASSHYTSAVRVRRPGSSRPFDQDPAHQVPSSDDSYRTAHAKSFYERWIQPVLDKKALNKYLDDLTNAEQSGVSQQAQAQLAAQLWLGLMNELLKGSPEMRVKQLGV